MSDLKSIWTVTFAASLSIAILFGASVSSLDADEKGMVNYSQLNDEEFTTRVTTWLTEVAPEQVESWKESFESRTNDSLTESAVNAMHLAQPEPFNIAVEPLQAKPVSTDPFLEYLSQSVKDDWMKSQGELWLSGQLVQRQLYDEAYSVLEGIDPLVVAEPAKLFFHRSVCAHQLLLHEDVESSLNGLLEQCDDIPNRYLALGTLMKQDLTRWKEKSLDEISRKMRDVERRLDLGRGGQKVQKIEQEIIESLDELIAKLEQQSGGGGGAGASSSNDPNSPAQESRVKGQEAPGEVDKKDLGNEDGWGKLPDKDQPKAKQILGTMFPPHYQRAIEAFNRKSAQRKSTNP